MQIISMIFYTAVTLGVLVFIHELGHFLAAKATGMRVDRFSIGFPPRAFGKKIGDTDYCVSWIPLGGYVKIAGMIDESMDVEFLNRAPEPWEFRARPMWARMFVISAGVIMNVLLAVAIFWGINYSRGKLIEETTEIGYVSHGTLADRAGLMGGDKILSVNGSAVTHWEEVLSAIFIDNYGRDLALTIERKGIRQTLTVSRLLMSQYAKQPSGIIEAHTVVLVGAVETGKPAEKLGLKSGDIFVALNDVPVLTDSMVITTVHANVGKPLKVTWKHGDQEMSGTVIPNEQGRIGISLGNYYNGPTRFIKYSIFEALPEGIAQIGQSVSLFIKSIEQLIIGRVSFKDSFGGPIAIAQMATQSAESGIGNFLGFMGLLSMSLAIINILPFPALDGGHLIMLILEKIFRREIPHRVKIIIQQAGFILLLAFMAFVIYNDISRL